MWARVCVQHYTCMYVCICVCIHMEARDVWCLLPFLSILARQSLSLNVELADSVRNPLRSQIFLSLLILGNMSRIWAPCWHAMSPTGLVCSITLCSSVVMNGDFILSSPTLCFHNSECGRLQNCFLFRICHILWLAKGCFSLHPKLYHISLFTGYFYIWDNISLIIITGDFEGASK